MRRKHYGSIVENCAERIKNIIECVSLKAFADEENPKEPEKEGGEEKESKPTISFEDLIAKARKEEKEKQYKTIEKLKGQVATLTQQHNDDLLKIAGIEESLKEAQTKLSTSGKDDSEAIKTLKDELSSKTKELEEANKKIKDFESVKPIDREEVEKEVRAELESEYEVKTYKAEKMAELKDDLLVPELIMGTTKEEIDASIESALARSAEIKKSLGIDGEAKKKEKRTPKSSTNPSVNKVQDNKVDMEYLASLDVSSEEYAKVRKQLGLH